MSIPSPRVTGSASGSTSAYRHIEWGRVSSTAGSTRSISYSQRSGEPHRSQVPRRAGDEYRVEHDEQIKEGMGAPYLRAGSSFGESEVVERTTVGDTLAALSALAPPDKAAGWDPVGLQLGDPGAGAGPVAVCHEVTDA